MNTEKPAVRFKRKQYFVAKRFQLKYVGIILLLMFLTAALCAYVVYYTSMILMGEKLANVYPQGRLVYIVNLVNFRILLSLILVTPLVALIGIFLSHRIAGPIFRMEKFLAAIASGDLACRIVLRKGDELMNLANGINLMVDGLKENVIKERGHAKKALEELSRLKKAIEARPIDPKLAEEMVDKVSKEMNNLSKELEKYRI